MDSMVMELKPVLNQKQAERVDGKIDRYHKRYLKWKASNKKLVEEFEKKGKEFQNKDPD